MVSGDDRMTDSPERAPETFEGIDDALALVRANGHRVSTACRVVLGALFTAEGPVSAQFIADGQRGRALTVELTSVYRNLERLEELGIVRHVHLGHGPGLYMLVGSGEKEFLACERCGQVTALDPAELEPVRSQIQKRFGYRARFGHFPIVGLCAACDGADAAPEQHQQHSHGDYVHAHPRDAGEPHRH